MRSLYFTLMNAGLLLSSVVGFTPLHSKPLRQKPIINIPSSKMTATPSPTVLRATPPDLDVIALVGGQECYGLAIVLLGEGVYSFVQAPAMANIRVLIPPIISAVVLAAVAGPLITSGDIGSVGTGLWIATVISLLMGASYVLRLTSPFSMVPKEVAFLGLLVAVAGFFSFGQNLVSRSTYSAKFTLSSYSFVPLTSCRRCRCCCRCCCVFLPRANQRWLMALSTYHRSPLSFPCPLQILIWIEVTILEDRMSPRLTRELHNRYSLPYR